MTQEEIKNETPLYYRCEGTATEDFSELRANKKYAEILKKMSFVDNNGHPLATCEDFIDLCERWQKLEAAVAWHGFDEVPKEGKEIDLVTDDGDIDREAGGDGLHEIVEAFEVLQGDKQ